MTSDFDYKKYSLENLEKWVSDALTSAEATPREIYDTIYDVVCEEYYHHKHHTSRCYDLMLLLNGNGNHIRDGVEAHGELWEKEDACMPPWGHSDLEYQVANQDKIFSCEKDDPSPECQKSWKNFWEENYYPEEYFKCSEKKSKYYYEYDRNDLNRKNPFTSQYTEEEMNAMCDKAASDQEKDKCREYNLREAEYYNKRAELDLNPGPQQEYLGWKDVSSEEFDKIFPRKDKVVKWQLPVEVDGASGEYFVQFPDDLLEASSFKEGDTIQWVDQGDGSYLLKKV